MEIHPVDYLAREVQVTRAQPSTYTALTLCDNATIDAMEILPPDARPAGAPVGVEWKAVPAFTTHGTPLDPDKLQDQGEVRVKAEALNWQDSSGSHKGKFFALYRVYWDTPCPAGKVSCQDSCVNRQSDSSNCGRCGSVCERGTSCSAGNCCPAGKTSCQNSCVDPQSFQK